jgi:hypothetical protein
MAAREMVTGRSRMRSGREALQRWADRRENGPQYFFSIFNPFFQLNKSAGVNKNRRNTWGPQENVKFCMEIDFNICHNFRIGHFD